jgi:hypothetical protein
MAQDREREKTAEELEREENEPDRSASDTGAEAIEVLDREARPLQRGETLDTPLGPLPKRSLAAMGLMLAVAVVVYLIAWSLLGTLGLLIGWIPAAALGLLAARELGRRTEG